MVSYDRYVSINERHEYYYFIVLVNDGSHSSLTFLPRLNSNLFNKADTADAKNGFSRYSS